MSESAPPASRPPTAAKAVPFVAATALERPTSGKGGLTGAQARGVQADEPATLKCMAGHGTQAEREAAARVDEYVFAGHCRDQKSTRKRNMERISVLVSWGGRGGGRGQSAGREITAAAEALTSEQRPVEPTK